jgi:hypothetical protein
MVLAVTLTLVAGILTPLLDATKAGAVAPGTINTVAGGGNTPVANGVQATLANLSEGGNQGMTVDAAGDVFITNLHDDFNLNAANTVWEIPVTSGTHYGISMTAGDMYAIAGGGSGCAGQTDGLGDGCPATMASLNEVDSAISVDGNGDIFIIDDGDNVIREVPFASGSQYGISMTAGDMYTVAGNETRGESGNGGPATAAELTFSLGFNFDSVAVDKSGNLFITDNNSWTVREVAAHSGTQFGLTVTAGDIYAVAGSGTCGNSGDGGPALTAEVCTADVSVDPAGDLLIDDEYNNVVREVPVTSGTHFGIAMTANDMYTVAGDAAKGFTFAGDGGPAIAAGLYQPSLVTVDSNGDLFITDQGNERVREVPATSGSYYSIAMTANDIYTVAGNGTAGYTGDGGPAVSAEISPGNVAVDQGGDLFINDSGNDRIREVQAAANSQVAISGTVNQLSGSTTLPVPDALVQACSTTTQNCTATGEVTGNDGTYTLDVPGPDTYVVTALPQPNINNVVELNEASSPPVTVGTSGVTGVNVTLTAPVSTPAGVSINGQTGNVPSLYWGSPSTVSVQGCPDGVATVVLTGTDIYTDALTVKSVMLTESPLGSGNYTGVIPPVYPVHGNVTASSLFDCQTPTALLPSSGTSAGGTSVQINGSGFSGATAVNFGSTPAASFSVVSDSTIDAVAPAGTGVVSVSVVTPLATSPSATATQYTYLNVSGVSPAFGSPAGGNTVTITGSGMANAVGLYFGDTAATSWSVISDTEIQATVPPGAGTADVSFVTDDGGSSGISPGDSYNYGSGPAVGAASVQSAVLSTPQTTSNTTSTTPTASSIHPSAESDPILAALTPSLENFAKQAELLAIFLEKMGKNCDPTNIGGSAAAAAAEAIKEVYGDLGKLVTNSLSDTAVTFAVQSIAAFLGSEGAATAALAVPGAAAAFTAGGALTAIAVVSAIIEVYNALKTQEARDNAQAALNCMGKALPKPPKPPSKSGKVGGFYFPGGSWNMRFDPSGTIQDTNGNPVPGATVTLLRSDSLAGPFTAPASGSAIMDPSINPEISDVNGQYAWDVYAGFYEVEATKTGCNAPGNTSQSTVSSPVLPVPPPQVGVDLVLSCPNEPPVPVPQVASLGLQSGPPSGGTSVTIFGSGFNSTAVVSFGSSPASSVAVLSPDTIEATSPPGSGLVHVTVKTTLGGTSSQSTADQFNYLAVPLISSVSPNSGPQPGGSVVQIAGSGFTTSSQVSFGSEPAVSTFLSGNQLSATAPAGSGTVDVSVSNLSGTSPQSASDVFTYVAPGFEISTLSLAAALPGQAYGPVQLVTTGQAPGATIKWKKLVLPKGLKLSSSGVLSGTLNKKLAVGPSSVTVQVTETVATLNGKKKVKTKTTVQATIPLTIT